VLKRVHSGELNAYSEELSRYSEEQNAYFGELIPLSENKKYQSRFFYQAKINSL